ncbi:MAG: SPOR domain-containing protein [Bacteroidales bacterium]|jgi:hypothetical protein
MKFTAVKKIGLWLTLSAIGTFISPVSGQEMSKKELNDRAMQYFEAEKYLKAATDFEVLYNMFPKDSRYAYYLGRSYFHANQKLDEAVDLLKYAATRNYGDNTYYYLGRAYHLNYQFDDAILAFLTFKKTAKSNDIKEYQIDYWIDVSNRAREDIKVAQIVAIEREKSVPANTLESAFDDELPGSYVYVPNAFRSPEDIEMNYQTLMFLPDDPQVGEYLYFESHSRKNREGLDIFRVEILSAEDFSLPEPLPGIINTGYDESHPYFDRQTGTLYFSSKGHNTMGGYDIFKCKYDTFRSEWTTVEKLNFPINSTCDEILYSALSRDGRSLFLSNRSTALNEYNAYTISGREQPEFVTLTNRDEVLANAFFETSGEADHVKQVYKKYEQGTLTEDELKKFDSPVIEDAGYEKLITEALIYQSQSDSLAWKVKELETKMQDEEDYQTKQVLMANIITLENELKRLQMLADEKFLLAEQKMDPVEVDIGQPEDQVIKAEDDIDGITLYAYTMSEGDADKTKETEYNRGREVAQMVRYGFEIQQTSPYSVSNPIPVVSIPGGLIYKIQLGSFSNPIPEDTFRGLAPLSKENEAGTTKYYVGNFKSLKEVRKALDKVKDYGYPDAFIVSFNNREKIDIQKAREIEFAKK